MNTKLDTKRIIIFLAFAFGIAWATGLIIALTGGLTDSPELAPNFTLALLLMATAYMWAPALATILTRLITREGWQNMGLRPNLKKGWRYYLAAWFLPPLLVFLGALLFFVIFPQHFDPTMSSLQKMLEANGQAGPTNLAMLVITQTVFAILLAPFINLLFAFGEELGWRSYLLQKLMPLGGRKAMLISGVIWGIWHWPVIFMGYEYGFEYPGAPVVGPLLFLLFTTVAGIFLSWVTLRVGSVWPAALGHAAINAIAGIAIFFTVGEPNPLLGPLPIGLIGMLPLAMLALWLYLRPGALEPTPGQWPAVADAQPAAQNMDGMLAAE